MEQEIELTKEKSEELAFHIEAMKMNLLMMDVDYAKQVVKSMYEQASWQDSAAVLNPMYDPDKQNILRMQSKMMDHLVKFIELGKEVDEMKSKVAQGDINLNRIMQMFM